MTTRTAPRTLRAVSTALSTGAALTLPSLLGLAAPATAEDDDTARVIELTNAERTAAGCAPVSYDPRAEAAAQGHARTMSGTGKLAHRESDGGDFADRMRAAGYAKPGAENIARGQDTPEKVVGQWMASPSHRENILDCSLRNLGVGHAARGDFWVQNFGR